MLKYCNTNDKNTCKCRVIILLIVLLLIQYFIKEYNSLNKSVFQAWSDLLRAFFIFKKIERCADVFLIYLNDLENIHEMNEASSKDKMVGSAYMGRSFLALTRLPINGLPKARKDLVDKTQLLLFYLFVVFKLI